MANTDYGAILLSACEATSQALNKRLGVSTGFKPSEWAENINLLVKPAEKSESGSVARFSDGADDMPLVSLVAGIIAVQTGEGDPSPENVRPFVGFDTARIVTANKNLIAYPYVTPDGTYDETGVYKTYPDNDGCVYLKFSSRPSEFLTFVLVEKFPLKAGTYTLSTYSNHKHIKIGVYNCDGEEEELVLLPASSSTASAKRTFVLDKNVNNACIKFVTTSKASTGTFCNCWITLEEGSEATGHAPTSKLITVPLGQTVYGGSLNVLTGVLTITHGHIDSYDGETISGPWMSSMDVYEEGSSPTTGAEVVYPLDEPAEVQLTPEEAKSFLGNNIIWANTGDVSLTYRANPS